MSILNPDRLGKPFFSIIFKDKDTADSACLAIIETWGQIDFKSDVLPFKHTKYYEKEFGNDLSRIFISLGRSINRRDIVDIKMWADKFERQTALGPVRTVNIDPGYLCLEQVILATGKNYTHRIYLGNGVFADLTLIYEKGSFRPLPWTYPDYGEESTIEVFNKLRETFLTDTRGRDRIK